MTLGRDLVKTLGKDLRKGAYAMLNLKHEIMTINLKMFDSESDGESQSQESDQFVYGIDLDEDESSNAQEDEEGSNETPSGDEKTPEETQMSDSFEFDFAKLTPDGRSKAYSTFKEQFKDEFQEDFQHHFDRRFKEHKAIQTKVNQYEPIIESLIDFYGAKDVAQLQDILQEDILQEVAQREGFTDPKKYIEYKRAKNEIEQVKKQKDESESEERTKKMIEGWFNESLEIQKEYPEFDLGKALDDDSFTQKLQKGLTVREAFKLTFEDSLKASRKESEAKAKAKARENRPKENGVKPSGGVQRKLDPSKLTDADFEEIRRQVLKENKKISFG